MSFHLSVNTVNCASQNRGTLAVTIQKRRANMQSPKRRGKRAVRGQNEGSYAIDFFLSNKWSLYEWYGGPNFDEKNFQLF